MPHLYDKAPPGFAKDPWAWDYTRDRMEQNTGLTYDQWEGKHFAGAAAMYKNVVKKYSGSIQQGMVTAPHECVDCGQVKPHYESDYVCQDCRDAIEHAGSYEAATQTINRPAALDDIRKQLQEMLGHKDAGKVAVAVDGLTEQLMERAAPGKVSRNYRAMSVEKLQRSIAELESGQGESSRKAQSRGEKIEDHLEAALEAAQLKGI
jgi:hypothetical protein